MHKIALALVLLLASCSPAIGTPAPVNALEPTLVAMVTPYMVCVTAENLNVRECPGMDCAVIGWVYRGECFTVTAQNEHWLFVGDGWIARRWTE